MCHLVLLMPLLTLPVFWLLPFYLAVPAYLVVLALSAGVYWLAIRAMHMPMACGGPALLHSRGVVVNVGRHPRIRMGGEFWEVESDRALRAGDWVEVAGRRGLTLRVAAPAGEPAHGPARMI